MEHRSHGSLSSVQPWGWDNRVTIPWKDRSMAIAMKL